MKEESAEIYKNWSLSHQIRNGHFDEAKRILKNLSAIELSEISEANTRFLENKKLNSAFKKKYKKEKQHLKPQDFLLKKKQLIDNEIEFRYLSNSKIN